MGGIRPPPSALSWRGVGYSVGRKALLPLLWPPDGWAVRDDRPSGAGKSTLLGVLAGRKRKGEATGEVRLHGYRSSASVRRARVGYVTQDDLLPGTSTVEEHLAFHTLLRCPWLAAPARQTLVDAALAAVALTPKADHIIGDGYVRGLSGGERRRVSVAVELLVAAARSARTAGSGGGVAPILLMDEPSLALIRSTRGCCCRPSSKWRTAAAAAAAAVEATRETTARRRARRRARRWAAGLRRVRVALGGQANVALHALDGVVPRDGSGRARALRRPDAHARGAVRHVHLLRRDPRRRAKAGASPNSAEAVIELVSSTDDATRERLTEDRPCHRLERRRRRAADDGGGGRRARPIVGIGGSSSNAADAGLEEGWRQGAWSSDFWLQLWALTLRSWTLMLRHRCSSRPTSSRPPALACCARGPSGGWTSHSRRACCSGWGFSSSSAPTAHGPRVPRRVALEKLLYFHERGVGRYGTVPFVLSKLLLADALPMRILPALLIPAIVYPTAGLNGIGATDGMPSDGPIKAATFVVSMCLTNLVGSAMFACIGILCSSTAVAVLLGVLYSLFTLLFSGFLANANQLPHTLGWLPYLSVLHYNFELVMSNELLGHDITVTKMWPGDPQAGQHQPVSGRMIVTDYLGFNRGWERECARVIPQPGGGHAVDQQISACWSDLYVPAMWYVGAVACACLLLKFCVRDPH